MYDCAYMCVYRESSAIVGSFQQNPPIIVKYLMALSFFNSHSIIVHSVVKKNGLPTQGGDILHLIMFS